MRSEVNPLHVRPLSRYDRHVKISAVRIFCTTRLLRVLLAAAALSFSLHCANGQESLSIAELNRVITSPGATNRSVKIRGVVNHTVPSRDVFGLQQDASGVMVRTRPGMQVPAIGTEVEIEANARFIGETIDTVVTADTLRVLGTPGLPAPVKCGLGDVLAGKNNRIAVELEAVVLTTSVREDGARMLFLTDGVSSANGLVFTYPTDWKPETLIGSRIRFRGIVGGAGFNALRCSTPDEITVLEKASAEDIGVITQAKELIAGGLDLAKRARAVRLRGVCTYPNSRRIHFYIHDGTGGIVINLSEPDLCPQYGEEVEVIGISSNYQNVVGVNAVTVKKVGTADPPAATRVGVDANGTDHYSQWLEIEGVVMEARSNDRGSVQFQVAGDNTWCNVGITKLGDLPKNAWSGARIRVRGVNAGYPRLSLFCADPSLITIITPGNENPFAAPITSAGALLSARKPSADRMLIEGTVLDVADGWIYLRNGNAAARADLLGGFPPDTAWSVPLTPLIPSLLPQVGQFVEIVGSPMVAGTHVDFRFGQLRVVRGGDLPEAKHATVGEVSSGAVANDLVTVRGRLRGYFSGNYGNGTSGNRWREVLRIEQDNAEVEVVYENANNRGSLAGFKIDDLIEATGIVRPEEGTPAYRLRARTLNDLRSLGEAPEVVWARQVRIFSVIGTVILAAAAWIILLRGKLKRERMLSRERMRADAAVRELNTSLESRVGQRTSELEKAQEELRRALAAEREVGELKSRFVSLVSHEFRTPLGITMSAVELLRGYMDRLSQAKRTELLDDIHEATLRMSGMMEQVLLLGRVEAGKLSFQSLPLDLDELGGKLADEMRSATSGKCLIEFTAENDISGARGDEGLMRHVFSNLLSNAVKYSSSGRPVEFRVRRDDGGAIFKVRDHGIGIPLVDQVRLFEAFHRAKNVGETPGTGLGLLIVKRCVELHHGTISFESREGEGTTFTVRLPLFDNGSGT